MAYYKKFSLLNNSKLLSGPPTGAPLLQPPALINSTAIRISWEEVNCNGIITGYNIQYHPNKEPQSVLLNVTAVTNITITGLTEFRLYYIRIAAINNNGTGPYSQELIFHTS